MLNEGGNPWKALGYDPSTCTLAIPSITDYQAARTLGSLEQLTVPAGKGYLIVVQRGDRK